MSYKGPYTPIANAVGKARMRSLTEETARHQRLADYAELSGFLERIAWMEERMMSMQVRNGQAFAMLQALKTLHLEILSAMTKVKGKS